MSQYAVFVGHVKASNVSEVSQTHNAVVVAVPQQHGAIVAGWAVQVQDERVCAVLLAADVGDVVPDYLLFCGWVHSFCLFSYSE